MTLVSKTFDLFGKTYVFEVGELAKQATGAALVKQGDSTVLTTVVVSSPTSRRTTSTSTVSSSRSSAFATTSSRDLCMQGRPLGAPFHVGPLSRR